MLTQIFLQGRFNFLNIVSKAMLQFCSRLILLITITSCGKIQKSSFYATLITKFYLNCGKLFPFVSAVFHAKLRENRNS